MATDTQSDKANKGLVPWGLHPMPAWIADVLNGRSKEYGANPDKDPKKYSGPRTAWARVFSNGISEMAKENLEGFVLGGTEGFNASYGFNDDKITLGVDAYGNLHEVPAVATDNDLGIPNDLPHRPPPSLVSVQTELLGGQNSSFPGLCRKIKIVFKCYSLGQLKYLVPYFFTPRITLVVEWGWNNYNPESLTDLTDLDTLKKIFTTPEYTKQKIEKSNGNYDIGMGYITDFGYSLNEAGGYDCEVTITNANFLIEGQSYQNTTIKKNESEDKKEDKDKIKLKDFNEFVFDDMGSLSVQSSKKKEVKKTRTVSSMTGTYQPILREEEYTVEENIDIGTKFNTRGKIFKPDNKPSGKANDDGKTWLKMDLIVEIINTFFSLKMLDENMKDSGVKISQFDISNVKMAAHPALKSVSSNILIPNQFAPRFVTYNNASTDGMTKSRLWKAKVENQNYLSLFKESIEDVLKENKFTDEYDDLRYVINPFSKSFPVFQTLESVGLSGEKTGGKYAAGYWGYLSDIYVDVDFFKKLVEQNDTLKTLIEALLQHISQATCNISQLKLITAGEDNSKFTVMDTNLTPISEKKDAIALPTIKLNSIDSAYIKSANLSIKLSAEMGNQMVMQSASGKDIPSQYGQGNVDPKTMNVSRFSRGDRMFDVGVFDQLKPSNTSGENKKSKYTRLFNPSDSQFYTYNRIEGKETISYILYEHDKSFMSSVINNKKDKKATYINNPMMPGTKFDIEFLGIGGITYLSQFTLANVLEQYSYEKAVWQVSSIKNKIEDKQWTTSITAEARPLTTI